MIEQLIRAIEMVLLKQLRLMTGNDPTSDIHRIEGHGVGPKAELWVGVRNDNNGGHKVRQFKITIEEVE